MEQEHAESYTYILLMKQKKTLPFRCTEDDSGGLCHPGTPLLSLMAPQGGKQSKKGPSDADLKLSKARDTDQLCPQALEQVHLREVYLEGAVLVRLGLPVKIC